MLLYVAILILAALLVFSLWSRTQRRPGIAFMHPYCEMGGGGEVVLWKMIEAIIAERTTTPIYVYTKYMTAVEEEQLRKQLATRFDFAIDERRIRFVKCRLRTLLEAHHYPRFTLFFQQYVGGLFFSLICLCKLNPTLLVESTGLPAALPVFRWLGGARVLVYMHYPTITSNMINRVVGRENLYNNAEFIARYQLLTYAKYAYYMLFAALYQMCGSCAEILLVNGRFTADHIKHLWQCVPRICYPPVALSTFHDIKSTAETRHADTSKDDADERAMRIVSLGQFRPEKNHRAQLETLALLRERGVRNVRLYMAGGVRNADDERLVDGLRVYAAESGLREGDDFVLAIGASRAEICQLLSTCMYALHTMIDEHFGIAVVELMTAGVLTIAHNSGGPRLDIIADEDGKVGFLGQGPSDYADLIEKIAQMTREERDAIRARARKAAERFDEPHFRTQIAEALDELGI